MMACPSLSPARPSHAHPTLLNPCSALMFSRWPHLFWFRASPMVGGHQAWCSWSKHRRIAPTLLRGDQRGRRGAERSPG